MFYVCEQTIPAQTTKEVPLRTSYRLSAGVITSIKVHWPYGAGNLAGVRLLINEFQYWPLSPNTWFNSTRRDLEFKEWFPIDSDEVDMVLEGYNDDDSFSHTVTVYIEVSRPDVTEQATSLLRYLAGEKSE
jgi:hypothetical protein